jgi:hypothetical protein
MMALCRRLVGEVGSIGQWVWVRRNAGTVGVSVTFRI